MNVAVFGILSCVYLSAFEISGFLLDPDLLCMNCENIVNSSMCRNYTTCKPNEICYIETTVHFDRKLYTSKCLQKRICDGFIRGPDIISRRQLDSHSRQNRAPTSRCLHCCSTNLCNNHCGADGNASVTAHTSSKTTTTAKILSTTKSGTTIPSPPTTKAAPAVSTEDLFGRKFLIVFLTNLNFNHWNAAQIMISSKERGWYYIHVPYLGLFENRTLVVGNNLLNLTYKILPEELKIEKKGVWIESSTKVNVYAMNTQHGTSDGFYVFPVRDLSRNYVIATETPVHLISKSLIAVSALEDGTVVDFKVKTNGTIKYQNQVYNSSNDNLSITLNQFETFQISGKRYDLTGSLVNATKSIAVTSGNQCGVVLKDGCSHLSEMIPPIELLSIRYIIPIFLSSFFDGDRQIRMVASDDSTSLHIAIDGAVKTEIMDSQEFVDEVVSTTSFMSVLASKPILVSAFISSNHYGPFMTLVPPVEKYQTEYTFSVPTAFTSFISVIIESTSVSGLRLDGNTITTPCVREEIIAFQGGHMFCLLDVPIGPGSHFLNHTKNQAFGLFVYGNQTTDGYGYFAGM